MHRVREKRLVTLKKHDFRVEIAHPKEGERWPNEGFESRPDAALLRFGTIGGDWMRTLGLCCPRSLDGRSRQQCRCLCILRTSWARKAFSFC